MENFCIRLADVVIGVMAEFPETKEYCKDFLTDEIPSLEIILTEQDRERAEKAHIKTDLYEGRTPGEYTETLLENTSLHLRILDELIKYNIVLFHGCVVAINDRAYMFCADSGTGKSTHAMLWVKNIPGCHIVNGDKPLLIFKDDAVCACGTPWRGKEGIGTDEILPLAGICLLERDTENHIEQISFKESFNQLLRQSYRPGDTKDLLRYMKLMQKLVSVPIYRLGCNMENEAALVAYQGVKSAGADAKLKVESEKLKVE